MQRRKEERSADDTSNNLGEEMRYILRAMKADEEVMTKSHGRILRKMRLPLLKKWQRIWKENRKASYQFLQMYQRRSY